MDKLSVIGISRSTGTINEGAYKGNPYDNTYFHCIKPANEEKGQQGQLCEIVKVKTSSITEMPRINGFIRPVYDRYGRVVSIEVQK